MDDKKNVRPTTRARKNSQNLNKSLEEDGISKRIRKTSTISEKDKPVKKAKETCEEKYIKLLAEVENIRKRHEQELIALLKYKSFGFIQGILPTIDMFEMALRDKRVSPEVKNWLKGFEMILDGFKNALKDEGVEIIDASPGDEFDSSVHFGIEEASSSTVKPGNIVKVKSKGYKLNDRLLKPAAVVVAKQSKKTNKKNSAELKEGDIYE